MFTVIEETRTPLLLFFFMLSLNLYLTYLFLFTFFGDFQCESLHTVPQAALSYLPS